MFKEGTIMTYIDGFLIPVPEDKRDDYIKMAKVAADVFLDHGALEVSECWGDDLIRGEVTDFYRSVQAEDGENVVFSWITWPSKTARDEGNAKAQKDERFAEFGPSEIFNGKRMIYSGFQRILHRNS